MSAKTSKQRNNVAEKALRQNTSSELEIISMHLATAGAREKKAGRQAGRKEGRK